MASTIPTEVQERIRLAVRTYVYSKGISQVELAAKMNIRTQTLYNYLSHGQITDRTVRKLSEALDYPYALLVNGLPYTEESQIDQILRRLQRIEEMLNIKY